MSDITIYRAGPIIVRCPHFYNEAQEYIRGNRDVIRLLPAVQSSALCEARESSTPLDERWRKERTLQRVLAPVQRQRTPVLSPVTSKPAFSDMVRGELPWVMSPAVPRQESAGSHELSKALRDVNFTAIHPPPRAYRGPRGSPPARFSNPQARKPYSSPLSSLDPAAQPPQPSGGSNQPNTTTRQPSPHHLHPTSCPPTPKLEVATLAVRGTPKLITIAPRRRAPTSHHHLQPPPPPPPTPNPHNNNRPRPHYTSPTGLSVLAFLRSHLLLDASTPPSAVLTKFLLDWPSIRRAALAWAVAGLDWRGVEGELRAGSFARRDVGRWVVSGGRGGLCGDGDGEEGFRWRWDGL